MRGQQSNLKYYTIYLEKRKISLLFDAFYFPVVISWFVLTLKFLIYILLSYYFSFYIYLYIILQKGGNL